MKRLIAAVSFAVLSAPVLAAGLPFEQTQLDRGIYNVEQKPEQNASAGNSGSQARVWENDHNCVAPAQ
jgi:hypothetical protein